MINTALLGGIFFMFFFSLCFLLYCLEMTYWHACGGLVFIFSGG